MDLTTEMANGVDSGGRRREFTGTRTKKSRGDQARGMEREGVREAKGARKRKARKSEGKEGQSRVRKGREIIKKVRKQKRRGVPAAKMAVPLAQRERERGRRF